MSVTSTTNKVQYNGDAASSAFPFTFKIYEETDLVLTIKNTTSAAIAGIAAEASVTLVLNTDYTITPTTALTLGPSAGSVTIVNALYTSLPVGLLLTILRTLPYTQEINAADNTPTPAAVQIEGYDRNVMLAQQLKEILLRTLTLGSDQNSAPVVPPLEVGALYTDGSSFNWQTLVTTETEYGASIAFGPDASKAASPGLGDLYIATDTYKFYKCFVGGAWSTAAVFSDAVTFSAAVLNLAKGAAVTSAATANIWGTDGNIIHISGSTGPITSLGTAPQAGAFRIVIFDSTPTLTHHATNLILPGGANIVAAAGDFAIVFAESTTSFRLAYFKANGKAVVETAQVPTPYTAVADTSTSDEATVSTSYVDTTLTLTFTPGAAGLCTAFFSGRGDSSSGIATVALLVDGTVVAECPIPSGVAGCNIVLAWEGPLSAAAHTIKIQQKGAGGGSNTLKGTAQTSRLGVNHPT